MFSNNSWAMDQRYPVNIALDQNLMMGIGHRYGIIIVVKTDQR